MRVVECDSCGECLSAANDDDLAKTVRQHMSEHHAESALEEDQVRELVTHRAYDAMDS